jgi:hypothetical protein
MSLIVASKLPIVVGHYLIPLRNELGVYIVQKMTTRLGVQLIGCNGTMVCTNGTILMLELVVVFGGKNGC